MPLYELGLLLSAELESEEREGFLEELRQLITAEGATITKEDVWGRRNLAYLIGHKREGYYLFWQYEGPGSVVKPLEYKLRLSEKVMRFIHLNLDRELHQGDRRQQGEERAEDGKDEEARHRSERQKTGQRRSRTEPALRCRGLVAGHHLAALGSVPDEGEERHVPSALDRPGELALVDWVGTGHAPRQDLARHGRVLPEQVYVLVVDVLDPLGGELADLLALPIELLLRHVTPP